MNGKPKAKTKAQIVAALAEKTGLTKKQVSDVLAAQAELAYREAEAGYTVSGIGKLVLVDRKERMGRNPATGQEIVIPAKRTLKFKVAKTAKDMVASPRG